MTEIGEAIAVENTLADAGAAEPQKTKTCHHPVKAISTLMTNGLDFGLRVAVTWESPTGSLADLGTCGVTEEIKYSVIPNPPFGPASGERLKESGQTQRIPSGNGIAASSGRAQDTHRHPRSLVRTPPLARTYTVDQTYDYNCTACGSGWVPFVTYRISYSILGDAASVWKFQTEKTGPGGPFVSTETV
jgi:hypothetical protein